MTATVLLVDADQGIGSVLQSTLRHRGHDVLWALTAAEADDLKAMEPPDLVLVNSPLPDLTTTDLIRRIRADDGDVMIVVLSARVEDQETLALLQAGADDHLSGSLPLTVLMARLSAHLRRHAIDREPTQVITVGRLRLDLAARRAEAAGVPMSLRPKEFDLLARLLLTPRHAVWRHQLISDVWGEGSTVSRKTLDMHISMVRRRLTARDRGSSSAGWDVELSVNADRTKDHTVPPRGRDAEGTRRRGLGPARVSRIARTRRDTRAADAQARARPRSGAMA